MDFFGHDISMYVHHITNIKGWLDMLMVGEAVCTWETTVLPSHLCYEHETVLKHEVL